MSKKKPNPTLDVVSKTLPGFQPGHPRYAGRRKRTAAQARALADQLGVDPLEYLLNLLTMSVLEEIQIDADGNEKLVKVPVSHEMKIEICKTLANFFYPRLTATQVTGKDEGPIAVAQLDVTRLIQDPAMVEMAQTLALKMADADRAQEPAQRVLPPGDTYPER
jgi:hypothetical protein